MKFRSLTAFQWNPCGAELPADVDGLFGSQLLYFSQQFPTLLDLHIPTPKTKLMVSPYSLMTFFLIPFSVLRCSFTGFHGEYDRVAALRLSVFSSTDRAPWPRQTNELRTLSP